MALQDSDASPKLQMNRVHRLKVHLDAALVLQASGMAVRGAAHHTQSITPMAAVQSQAIRKRLTKDWWKRNPWCGPCCKMRVLLHFSVECNLQLHALVFGAKHQAALLLPLLRLAQEAGATACVAI